MRSYYMLQWGRTPLHKAVSVESNKHVVETLIKAGADVTIVDIVSYCQTLQCKI